MNSDSHVFKLVLDPAVYVVEKLAPDSDVVMPPGDLAVIMRRGAEITRIRLDSGKIDEARVLESAGGWRALVIDADFDFEAVGVLASLSAALAAAGIPLLAISTWATDILFIGGERVEAAVGALEAAGHEVLVGP